MHSRIVGPSTVDRGLPSSWVFAAICVSLLGMSRAGADPSTLPDPPPRRQAPAVGPAGFPPTESLDGLYVWLGPIGAAGRQGATWDSMFGGDLTIVRVREGAGLGAIGASAGASLWAARGGGRIWLDGLVGTRLGGRMYGATLGPLVELAELAHPRVGGAVGLWAFFGPTPYARVGVVEDLGAFVEIGLHLALPVFRR
jgi:hypothetical protein